MAMFGMKAKKLARFGRKALKYGTFGLKTGGKLMGVIGVAAGQPELIAGGAAAAAAGESIEKIAM